MEHQLRIVIADDHPATRAGLRGLLGVMPGWTVVGEAGTGQAAVDLIDSARPHVILMDVHMPVMDGLRATQIIKDRWPHVIVIVLTMHDGSRRAALDAGADFFFPKGGPMDRLVSVVRDLQHQVSADRGQPSRSQYSLPFLAAHMSAASQGEVSDE